MPDPYDPRIEIHGEGVPIVLVPGMDGTGRLFYRQVVCLARTYRVATYALRDTAETMNELVGDLERVVDAVAPEERRAIVIGESFGGALAMTFALEKPEHVRALVVVNSFPHFVPQNRLHLAMWGIKAIPWGAMALVRRLTASRLHSRHTHRDEIRRFLALTAAATRDGYIGRLKLLTEYDVRDRLRDLRVPALFLAADRDHLVPAVQQARDMAERVPGSVVHVLTGHGHICLIAPDLDLEQILGAWSTPPHAPATAALRRRRSVRNRRTTGQPR